MKTELDYRTPFYQAIGRVMRSKTYRHLKAGAIILSPEGRRISLDLARSQLLLRNYPRHPVRQKVGSLDVNHDAVAIVLYHQPTGIPKKRIIESGALDLVQTFYGHIYSIDAYLDKNPQPSLASPRVWKEFKAEFLKKGRAGFRKDLERHFPQNGKQTKALLKLFDEFNQKAVASVLAFQAKANPTLDEAIRHREETVGLMSRYGARIMDEAVGRSPWESREYNDAAFNAAMAVQVQDDLTDLLLDEKAGSRENIIRALLVLNREYEAAKPYFGCINRLVLRRVAPQTFKDARMLEMAYLSKIPKSREYAVLRILPTVF